jgi:hypothetical protein
VQVRLVLRTIPLPPSRYLSTVIFDVSSATRTAAAKLQSSPENATASTHQFVSPRQGYHVRLLISSLFPSLFLNSKNCDDITMVSSTCSYDCSNRPNDLSPEPDITGIGVSFLNLLHPIIQRLDGLTS